MRDTRSPASLSPRKILRARVAKGDPNQDADAGLFRLTLHNTSLIQYDRTIRMTAQIQAWLARQVFLAASSLGGALVMRSNTRGEWRRANTATYANRAPSRRQLNRPR